MSILSPIARRRADAFSRSRFNADYFIEAIWAGKSLAGAHRPQPYISASSIDLIYFAVSQDAVKIGVSRNPGKRLIKASTFNPFGIEIAGAFIGGREDERKLHRALGDRRLSGEWFSLDQKLSDIIFAHTFEYVI